MKKILFVQSRPPHGTLFGQEGLDAILMGSAFARCSVLLVGDGIYQLLNQQNSDELGTRDYSVSYMALSDYGVTDIYCTADHLRERGLTTDDLLIKVTLLDVNEVRQLMTGHDVILDF